MKKCYYALLCVVGIMLPLISFAQPTANFSANITSGCSPILVQFTDLSTGSPTNWQWNLGNGTSSNLQNPSTTYFTPGTYTITLTASNGSGSNTKTVTGYITVYPSPIVAFAANDSTASCPPKTVQFTDMSTAGTPSATYLWDFGDGTTSSQQNPVHTYTSSGNYSVSLIVTNSSGCTRTLTKNNYIQLVPKSLTDFTSTNNNSCTAPATVNFTNTSGSGIVNYLWDFGDGTTSTQVSPTHTYTNPGSYTVKLLGWNAQNCVDSEVKQSYVNIGAVNANFITSTSAACTHNNITFTNTTTPGAGNSTWYFGDGTTATTANAIHAYTTPGTYNVKLVVENGGCKDSITKTVVVNPGPLSQFSISPTAACSVPTTITFNNTSTGATSYYWEFGNGSTSTAANPTHTYNSVGTFAIKLVAIGTNGCKDTSGINLPVSEPTASITSSPPSGACVLSPIQFNSSITSVLPVTNYSWNFGDGTTGSGPNPVHTYTSAGVYTVTLTYTVGSGPTACTKTVQVNRYINPKPTAAFSVSPTVICPGQAVTFTNNSTPGITYFWNFGDYQTSTATNPVHTYTSSGTYTVTLVANNNGCRDTATQTVIVQLPTADFNILDNCSNRLQFTFQDLSQGANTYSWNFGDGNTSTQAGNVTHTYATYGTYPVTLTVTNTASGCTMSYIDTVIAFPLTAQFTATDTTICTKTSATFTAAANNYITDYFWSFGNGFTHHVATNPESNYYSTAGTYTIKLVVTDIYGCKDSLTRPNYLHVGPSANVVATPQAGCAPFTTTLQNQSTLNPGTTITSKWWSLGNGTTSTSNSNTITATYPNKGNYTVKFAITDSEGCTDTIVKTNYINVTKPEANFTTTYTNYCPGENIPFVNNSTGTGLTYSWDFGDGTTSAQQTPTHAYANPGTYTVRLIVSENGGACKDTMTKVNYITIQNVNASFTVSDTFANCPPLTVTINNTSTGISTYNWYFGNGNTSSLTNPTTTYTYPGVYTIKLVGHSSAGCADSFSKNITILGPTGTFSYSPTNACLPATVNFTAVSNNTQVYIWDMNNGVTQSTTNPSFTYTYTQAGQYVPKLILSDGASCNVPVTGIDTIKVDSVYADFTFQPATLCQSGTVQFTDTTYQALNPITTYLWDFGDGTTGNTHNPTHFYAAPGNYQVKLIVGTTQGCTDTINKTVIVHPSPNVSAGPDKVFCSGSNAPVQLQATGATTYAWSPATGLSCTNCANPTALPSATITYTVIGTTAAGCSDTDQVVVTVNPQPTVSAGADQAICAGATAQLQATGAATYSWSPAIGLSCTNCPNPIASPATTTTYTVIGTSAAGCSDTDQIVITVAPVLPVNAGPDTSFCAGSSVQLQATGATSYTWSPATGLSCTNCPNPIASPTTTTIYTVTGTSGNCSNTDQIVVAVKPLPTVSAGPNKNICIGSSTTLQATGAMSYSWSPATGLSCTNCANPTANPATTTTYTVTGLAANGCSNTSQVTVTVNPQPTVSAGADQTICANASAQLQATGATTYSWSPATGLSCTNCANPTASPAATTTYTVIGIDANGCSDTDQIVITVAPQIPVNAGPDTAFCAGSSVQLLATGASNYTWSPATGLSCTNCANPVANPATTTTYTVTGTSGSCSNTDQVTVTVKPLPTVSAGNNQSICIGSSAQLQATGAVSYSWSPATGLSCTNCANPTATPTTTTTYTVTGIGVNGCSNTSQVTVTVNPQPTVSGGADKTICVGASANLQATGANTYTWSPATGLSCTNCANPTATPTTPTVYTVIGVNANGCSDTDQVAVNFHPQPVVSAGADVAICPGFSTQLQASGANTYTWSPAAGLSCTTCPNPTATPTTTTTYTVIGIGPNGCSDTDQVVVTVTLKPVVNAGLDKQLCIGSSTQLQASGANNYTWSPSAGLSCTNCANPTANPTTTTTYTVIGTNTGGCSDTDQIVVAVNPLPTVSAGADQTVCSNAPAQLQASGAASYTWSPAAGLSCTNCPNPVATVASTTTYTVTGTDAKGCTNTDNVTITTKPLPTIDAGPDEEICDGASVQLQANGGDTYTWSPAAGLSCTNCDNPVANPTATTTYTVTGTGTNGCTNTDQITVVVNPLPNVDAGADKILCDGQTVQLQATGAATYVWSPMTALSCINCPDPYANPTSNITYTVTGTDAKGCVNSDDITITVVPKRPTSVGPGGEICEGESVNLSASGGDSYLWLPAAGLNNNQIPNPVATPDVTTTYLAIIKQAQCFADTHQVQVIVHPVPTVTLGPDKGIVAGESIELNASGTNIATYLWTPSAGLSCDDCANPVATPGKNTTYVVQVTSDFGCTATDDIAIRITCDNSQLFIPNTFTPNADGLNDRFYPMGKGISIIKRFRIYDRWGELIYDRHNIPPNDPLYGWDGTHRNIALKPDVYVYIVDAECDSGEPLQVKGDISIVK